PSLFGRTFVSSERRDLQQTLHIGFRFTSCSPGEGQDAKVGPMSEGAAIDREHAYVRPVRGRRAFEEILLQLEEAISAGHLSAGDRLPPERELATRFQVSRTSVREALRVLETLGIVSVRRGAENGATLREEPGNALTQLLRF